ncbi:cysteine proteinase inhibitor A-like [Andrographis paniculata]|uniref:cysteine proteinase inhibitor A-like n=1 Tax=Andrographis paniculata TaxID=175694 RepID=UPI0021E7AE81|nr:cysteine proteinase inhibitor A-like [Andrographis paniculata]
MATLGGIRQTGGGSHNSLEIENLARFAVAEHNKKQNALLEFKRVTNVKEQVVAGKMYYITLEAEEGGSGQKKAYEAKVWEKSWMNFKELQDFKPITDDAASS